MISDDYIKITFAKNLKRLLHEHSKNQTDLVRDLGLKASTISEWVNARKYPRMDKVQMLATYFNCNVSDLVGTETEYVAQVVNKRTTMIDDRLTNFVEEIALRKSDFYFEGTKLDDDDIDLLRLMTSNLVAIYRASLKNKYRGTDNED